MDLATAITATELQQWTSLLILRRLPAAEEELLQQRLHSGS